MQDYVSFAQEVLEQVGTTLYKYMEANPETARDIPVAIVQAQASALRLQAEGLKDIDQDLYDYLYAAAEVIETVLDEALIDEKG